MKFSPLYISFFLIVVLSNNISAQTNYYWKPVGGSTSAKDPNNWRVGSCGSATKAFPSTTGVAVFSNCSTTGCVIDTTFTVGEISVVSSYTGTISVSGSNTIHCDKGSFKGGTFTGNTGNITCDSSIVIDGTAFTSTSGILTTGEFTYKTGGFTHNSGTVKFIKGSHGTTVISSTSNSITVSFYKAEFGAPSHNTSFNVKNIDIQVNNELKLSGDSSIMLSSTTNSVIQAKGDVVSSNKCTTGGGMATIEINGTGSQTWSDTYGTDESGKFPNVKINKSSGTLSLSGSIVIGGSAELNFVAGTLSPGTSSLILYYNNEIRNNSGDTMNLYNLEVMGNGGKDSVKGTITVTHNFTTSQSGNCVIHSTNGGNGILQVQGNIAWNNTATSSFGNVSFELTGSNNQIFTGAIEPTFYNLKINKSIGYDTLKKALSISNNLNLIQGYLTTDTVNILTMLNGATLSGGSSNSFIDGPVKKVGNAAFTFPIGDNDNYKPLAISAPSSSTESFTALHFQTAQTKGSTIDTGMTWISDCEYWNLKHNSGSTNVTISLGYNYNSCAIVTTSTLRMARWNGTKWVKVLNTTVTGDRYSGTIATTSTYSDGYFVIAKQSTALAAHAGNDTSLCADKICRIGAVTTATGGLSPYSYTWEPTSTVDTFYIARPIAFPSSTTAYILTVTDKDGVTAKDTITVTVRSRPTIDPGQDKQINIGDSVQLGGSPTISGGVSPLTLAWSPSTGLSNTTGSNPYSKPNGSVAYTLKVTDNNSCEYIQMVDVTVSLPSIGAWDEYSLLASDSIKFTSAVSVAAKVGSNNFVSTTVTSSDSILVSTNSERTALADAATFAGSIHSLNRVRINRQLGGQILSPGVYKVDSTAVLDGTLTLNGNGHSFFIFDFADSFIVKNNSLINLENVATNQIVFRVGGKFITQGSSELYGIYVAIGSMTLAIVTGDMILISTTGKIKGASFENRGSTFYSVKPGNFTNSNLTDYFGYNCNNITDGMTDWTTLSLLNRLPELNPQLFRMPAGGKAKNWNWNDGWFQNPLDQDFSSPEDIDISDGCLENSTDVNPLAHNNKLTDFKFAINSTNSAPIYVMNMNLNSAFEWDYINYANTLKLPIKYIELGNEFYLQGNTCRFQTATSYASEVNNYLDFRNSYYGNTHIGIVAVFNSEDPPSFNKDCRGLSWNATLLSSPNLMSKLKNDDALTYHIYLKSNLTTEITATYPGKPDADEIPDMLSYPFVMNTNFMNNELLGLKGLSKSIKAWITEYNLRDKEFTVHGSWAHGLFVAAMTLTLIESDEVAHIISHCLVSDFREGSIFNSTNAFESDPDCDECIRSTDFKDILADNINTKMWELTAQGITLKMIAEALRNATSAKKLTIPNSPPIKDDLPQYPALYGWKFIKDYDEQFILLNLSSDDRTVNMNKALTNSGHTYYYEAIGYNDPFVFITGKTTTDPLTGEISSFEAAQATWDDVLPDYVHLNRTTGILPSSFQVNIPAYGIIRIYRKTTSTNITVTASSSNICAALSSDPSKPGSTINLYAQGAFRYLWSVSPSSSLSFSNLWGSSISISKINSTATYTITATGYTDIGSTVVGTPQTVTVGINSKPTGESIIKAQDDNNFTLSSSSGSNSYNWSPSVGLNQVLGSSITGELNYNQTYTMTFVNSNGCFDKKDKPLNARPLFPNENLSITCSGCTISTSTIPPSTDFICKDVEITLSSSLTDLTCDWYDNYDNIDPIASNTTSITVNPSATTTYVLKATGNGNSRKAYLTLNIKPSAEIDRDDYFACTGGSVSMNATASKAGSTPTYAWTAPVGDFSDPNSLNTDYSSFGSAGDKTITFTVSTSCSGNVNASDVALVHVATDITGLSISTNPAIPVCNQQVTLTASPSTGVEYTWRDDQGGTTFVGTNLGNNVHVRPILNATTSYTVTVSHDCCCKESSASITLSGCRESNENIQSSSAPEPINFRLFPNPTEGNFNIEIQNYDADLYKTIYIEVFDIYGNLIQRFPISMLNGNYSDQQYLKLQDGIYFIVLNTGNNKITQKLTILH